MRVIEGIENIIEKFSYPVLTIGNFDGVHLGHQAIFQMIVRKAKEKRGTSIVFTFDPHPMRVIAPQRAPKLITLLKDRIKLIGDCGIDVLICAKFTKELANMSAEDFVRDILLNTIGMKEIFVGSNYLFGKERKGSPELLKKMGGELGFVVTIVSEIKLNDTTVSSSKIRSLVVKGKVEDVSILLGRQYSVEGIVVKGTHRGRRLFNIPTANILPSNELIPKDGVYAVTVNIEGGTYKGAANIGYNPTFGGKELRCEVHIFEFDRNIMGETLRINFVKKIRDEIKFHRIEDLAEQMRRDIEDIKQILNKNKI